MSLVIKLTLDNKEVKLGLKSTKKEIQSVSEAMGKHSNSLAIKAGVAAAALFGYSLALKGIISEAMQLETVKTQFEVLTGSIHTATKVTEDLVEFGKTTPFELKGLAAVTKQLLGFGFRSKEVMPILQNLGDVSSAIGVPLNELAQIYGQVSKATRLTGRRMFQLEQRAVPLSQAIAKTMGISQDAVSKMVAAGKVSFDIFAKAMQSISEKGGLAFGGMEKRSQTLEGRLSNLEDVISVLKQGIGTHLLPVTKTIVAALTEFLETVANNEKMVKRLMSVIISVGVALVAATGYFAGAALGSKLLSLALASSSTAMGALGVATKVAIGATGLGLFIIFLPDLVKLFKDNWDEIVLETNKFVATLAHLSLSASNYTKNFFNSEVYEEEKLKIDAAFAAVLDTHEKDYNAKKAMNEKAAVDAKAAAEKAAENEESLAAQKAKIKADAAVSQISADKLAAHEQAEEIREQKEGLLELEEESDATRATIRQQESELEKADATLSNEELLEIYRQGFDAKNDLDKENAEKAIELVLERNERLREIAEEEKAQQDADAAKDDKDKDKLERQRATQKRIKDNVKLKALRTTAAVARKVLGEESIAAFMIEKAAAIASIAINTSAGVMKAVAAFPLSVPPGTPWSTAIAVLGATQAALVMAQTPPKMKEGGLIGHQAGTPSKGDYQLILGERGELVIPTDDVGLNRQANDLIIKALGDDDAFFREDTIPSIDINLNDELSDVAEAQLRQNRAIGIGVT